MSTDQLTVSVSPYSADELVKRVAHNLSEHTREAISEKVEEILGESIDALIQDKLGEYLGRTVEELVASRYTPVSEGGVAGEESTLDDQMRAEITAYIDQPCELSTNRQGRKIVPHNSSYGRPDGTRYELMVKEAARTAAAGLVQKEIIQHTTKMKKDATEAVKQLVAEHIVSASEKRQLNGGLPT